MAEHNQSNNQDHQSEEEHTNAVLQKFQNFIDSLGSNELKEQQDAVNQGIILKGEKGIQYNLKREHWKKSLELHEEYLKIRETIAIKLKQAREELITTEGASGSSSSETESKGNINQAIAEFTELTTYFDSSIGCIKSVQHKLLEVLTAVSRLKNAIKDPCNANDLKQLEKGIPDWHSQVEYIWTCADEACNEAKGNFEDAVKAAGIKALLTLDSIQELGVEIAEQVDAFYDNVEECLTTAQNHEQEKRTELDQAIRELCEAEDDCKVAEDLLAGYEYLMDFARPSNSRSESITMDRLLKKAEKNFEFQFKLEEAS